METVEKTKTGRLSSAIFTAKGVDFAGTKVEINAVQNDVWPEIFSHPV
jgi:hypothetical protein